MKAYKPNPAMYLGACALLSLKPEECAMVASHIFDLQFAASYGVRLVSIQSSSLRLCCRLADNISQLRTIYIPRETEDQGLPSLPDGPSSVKSKSDGGEVDVVISSLAELPGLFKS